ncbi:hypothetical protein F5Y15DRAFT_378421 [Xylariaceae sp. FL0016]|nr:hypothetical protein F5Y15DRAFT_378421 [Xylariaceae sp. FL0016]
MASHHSMHKPRSEVTRRAASAVSRALGNADYALVGGAACSVLGSNRLTADVDFVVPKGATKTARALLKQHPTVSSVDKRTQHTTFVADPTVEIEILAPPALFQQDFSPNTPTLLLDGVRVLKPALLINAKCGSLPQRNTEEKQSTDSEDILFLLEWCARHKQYP